MKPHIQAELDYQEEEKKQLITENEAMLVKGAITELQHDARLDKIIVDYKEIVRRILAT